MDTPTKMRMVAQRLRAGHRINRMTVRDFLGHFGAERRGAGKVQAIREILATLGLETEPDFETAWIDEPIWIKLKNGVARVDSELYPENRTVDQDTNPDIEDILVEVTSKPGGNDERFVTVLTSEGAETQMHDLLNENTSTDPTHRIGSLAAANKPLVVANVQDSLPKVVTLMLQHDFSQLPVMQGERDVKGVVTWKAIGSRQALGSKCDCAADCQEIPRIVDSNRTLFDTIPAIVEYGYVLVRDERDRRITGIVTASDLSMQFQVLSEPFLLLREIELHIRQLLHSRVTDADFEQLGLSASSSRKPQNVADLSFGEYARLIQHPDIWPKLGLKIDPGSLVSLLEEVRIIRNDVMHFDPDPMTSEELGTLKRAVHFMQDLYNILPKNSEPKR